jgi:ribosomal protein S18 acetylase RimI-like enzyme
MITIRKAIREDAEVIIAFQQKMAWETELITLDQQTVTDGVKAVFDNVSYGQYWIAEENNIVLASLLITYEWSDWRNTNVWWFQSVYVLPDYRRRGIFSSLYSHIKEESEIQGVAGLRLYVETNNLSAQKTYETLGMKNEHYAMYEWLKV